MNFKRFKGKIFGVTLNSKEQATLELEARRIYNIGHRKLYLSHWIHSGGSWDLLWIRRNKHVKAMSCFRNCRIP